MAGAEGTTDTRRAPPEGNAANMPGTIIPNLPLDTVAHIIQVALTPVFLLSGIATLLNVFSTRLG
jgi:hypothetical protein